jgi:hypothetical protein
MSKTCVIFEHIDVFNFSKTQRNTTNLIVNVQQASKTIKCPKYFPLFFVTELLQEI